MTKKRRMWWLGELLVIVAGVLIALAVDDAVQRRADRATEAHLLERLADDLVADAGDLALAQLLVARRTWLFTALLESTDGRVVDAMPPDTLLSMGRYGALLEAAGRPEAGLARSWPEPIVRPLLMLRGFPEFDISDDSYTEMIETGALRTLRDRELRSVIMAYNRTAEDLAANVMRIDQYNSILKEELLQVGVSFTDTLSLEDLGPLVRQHPSMTARLREIPYVLGMQAGWLRRIEEARLGLERELEGGGR